nr:ribonuclease H-like domain-containing protein [Tanacetum cinerariifolium]
MDQQNLTLAKIPILDTEKFEQWQFRIQQYLQHEHYALWEVIEFGDSYEAPTTDASKGSASEGIATKKGMTVALTTEDMQKRKNDVKARTTLLLALPGEHQLRFSKYKTTQELWAAILKTFSHQEDEEESVKTAKFFTSLALEWLMHTIVWRNRSDFDTMSLDDLYNHLKVYESEVQKKSESNSQNMAFISSAKNSSGKEDVNTASIPTASTNVSPASVNIRAKKTGEKISIQRTDVAGFDKSKVECSNCHKIGHFARECRAPRSQDRERRDNYRQGSKVEEQAPQALMAIDGKNTESLNSKITDLTDKLCDSKNMLFHYKAGLSQVEGRLVEFKNQKIKFCEKIRVLEFSVECKTNRIENLTNELETLKKEKEGLESKLTGFKSATKDLDNLIGSQRSDKIKEGLGYSTVPPPAQVYSPPKKDMSWTGLPEFADDTITNYTSPSLSVESNQNDLQNSSSSASENGESTSGILSKHEIKFVRSADSPTVAKSDKKETVRKPSVKYAELYRKPTKRKFSTGNTKFSTADMGNKGKAVKASACWILKPSQNLSNKGYGDSGCSQHMTCNISYLSDYELFDGGYVSFAQGGCKITGKGTIKTGKLEFENVYFVKNLKYNLFSVSQICDNKNIVLFTDSECIVLGRDFKLIDDTNMLLRTPRQHNMYSIDLNNIVLHKDLTCLVAKASTD